MKSAQALGYTARPSFHQTQRGERGNGTNTTHDCPESHDAAHIDTTVIAFLGPRGTIGLKHANYLTWLTRLDRDDIEQSHERLEALGQVQRGADGYWSLSPKPVAHGERRRHA